VGTENGSCDTLMLDSLDEDLLLATDGHQFHALVKPHYVGLVAELCSGIQHGGAARGHAVPQRVDYAMPGGKTPNRPTSETVTGTDRAQRLNFGRRAKLHHIPRDQKRALGAKRQSDDLRAASLD
jgi:hypothetical protein